MAALGASIRARMSDALRAAGSRGKDRFLHLMYGEDLKRVQVGEHPAIGCFMIGLCGSYMEAPGLRVVFPNFTSSN